MQLSGAIILSPSLTTVSSVIIIFSVIIIISFMTPVTIPPLDPVKQDAAVSLRVPAEPGGAVPGVRPPVEVSMKFRELFYNIRRNDPYNGLLLVESDFNDRKSLLFNQTT